MLVWVGDGWGADGSSIRSRLLLYCAVAPLVGETNGADRKGGHIAPARSLAEAAAAGRGCVWTWSVLSASRSRVCTHTLALS